MSREPSRYVCARCGLAAYTWAKGNDTVWKHAAGGWQGPKSCGQPPVPILRTTYEAGESAALQQALERKGR